MLVMQIHHAEQQTAAWFENDVFESSASYISKLLTMDLFCTWNFANVAAALGARNHVCRSRVKCCLSSNNPQLYNIC